jgi:three prime repair exonuclease-1
MQEVRTLVFLDLEATGLKSSGKPRICEISLIAVNIEDMLDMSDTILGQLQCRRNERTILQADRMLPRILNKLTLCVYPMATIVPLVSDLTGLDNYNLSGQSMFNKNTGDLINNFLLCLPSPVCLIAHNGNSYDFPLLKSEMEKANTKLSQEILCADSYIGIKEIISRKLEIDASNDLIEAGAYDEEMLEGISDEDIEKFNASVTEVENNTTPRSKKQTKVPTANFKKHLHQTSNPSRKLIFSNLGKPTSFSLVNLHKHFLGFTPDQSHGAEADCITLLRTTAALGNDWIDWMKDNCYLIADCTKMWGLTAKAQ